MLNSFFVFSVLFVSLSFCARVVEDEDGTDDFQFDEVVLCPAGYYLDHENMPQQCQKGFYCVDGHSLICDEGHFCGELGMINPQVCPKGHFCDTVGMVIPKKCQAGFYCPLEGMTFPFLCNDGFYTPDPEEAVEQIQCPIGSTCNGCTRSECEQGFYCPNEGMTYDDSMICEAGFHCPDLGQVSPTPCPESYYCPETGMINVEFYICPGGYYCDSGCVDPKVCPTGFYCPGEGLAEPIVCPPGFRCPQPGLVEPLLCQQPGSHCNEEGMVEAELCPIGFSCPNGDLPIPSGKGFYVPESGSIEPWVCIEGHYCPDGINTDMTVCPVGFFCPYEKMTEPYPCPPKHYCEMEGMSEPGPTCEPRQACPQGTAVPRLCPAGSYCDDSIPFFCPVGYYCPNEGMIENEIVPCEAGYFCGPFEGQSSPTICPRGSVCPERMMSNSFLCPAGQYCPEEGNSEGFGILCPSLHFCPIGSSQPLSCPSGKYGDEEGLVECKDCPTGFYCEEGMIYGCLDAFPWIIRGILEKNDKVGEYATKVICPFEGMGIVMIYSNFLLVVFVVFVIPLFILLRCVRRIFSKKGEDKKPTEHLVDEEGFPRNKLRYDQHSSDEKEEEEEEELVEVKEDEKYPSDELHYPEPIDFKTVYSGYLLENGERKDLKIEMNIENQEKRLRGGGTDDNLRYIVKGEIQEGEKVRNYNHREDTGSIWYVFKKVYEDDSEIEFEAPEIIIPQGEHIPKEIVGTYQKKSPMMVGNFRVNLVSSTKVY